MPAAIQARDAAVLVSGGVDSATLCIELLRESSRVFPIYVEAKNAKRNEDDVAATKEIADRCSGLFKIITQEEAEPRKPEK